MTWIVQEKKFPNFKSIVSGVSSKSFRTNGCPLRFVGGIILVSQSIENI